MLLAGLVLTTWTDRLLSRDRDQVVHTHEVIETTKDVLIALDDLETGQRGFLLTGDASALRPYEKARDRLDGMLARLRDLARDNVAQQMRLDGLAELIARKLAALQAGLAGRQSGGLPAALAAMEPATDRALMDAIRHDIGQITHAELALLDTRRALVAQAETRAGVVAVVIGVLSLLTRAAVEIVIARRERRRINPQTG